ncbi:MAG: TetR family transcriptional regulator C-terminal domain-containing protein [Solobacterium sp.]|nr:TetR family transcriptional regulator C-terminal domain-containing protein [Solobacterium sp.]
MFGSLFRHYHDHAAFYTMLLRQNMSWVILDTIKEKTGMVAELSNREAYAKAFFAYGLYGWVCEWIERGMQESPEEINAMIFKDASARN